MKIERVYNWEILNVNNGRRRKVTMNQALAVLKANPRNTYKWIGSLCMVLEYDYKIGGR